MQDCAMTRPYSSDYEGDPEFKGAVPLRNEESLQLLEQPLLVRSKTTGRWRIAKRIYIVAVHVLILCIAIFEWTRNIPEAIALVPTAGRTWCKYIFRCHQSSRESNKLCSAGP